jgi:hypothetical protein
MVAIATVLGLSLAAACGGATGAGEGGGTMAGGGGGGGVGEGGGVGGGTEEGGSGAAMEAGALTIQNVSNYVIHEMYMTANDDNSWGPDLLGGDVLLPGEEGRVPAFSCAEYDLRLIDDDGGECIVNDIDLCFQEQAWTVNDVTLDACADGWGQR